MTHRIRDQTINFMVSIARYTLDICWKIYGYPSNIKNNTWEDATTSNANTAMNETSSQKTNMAEARFTKEQYDQLLAMLNCIHRFVF